MSGLHNFVKLCRILPLPLTKLTLLHQDRVEFHKEMASRASTIRTKKRKKTSDKRREAAAAKRREAELAAKAAAEAEEALRRVEEGEEEDGGRQSLRGTPAMRPVRDLGTPAMRAVRAVRDLRPQTLATKMAPRKKMTPNQSQPRDGKEKEKGVKESHYSPVNEQQMNSYTFFDPAPHLDVCSSARTDWADAARCCGNLPPQAAGSRRRRELGVSVNYVGSDAGICECIISTSVAYIGTIFPWVGGVRGNSAASRQTIKADGAWTSNGNSNEEEQDLNWIMDRYMDKKK
ncbi:hypothetical protein B0H14DRAFT_3163919 [Mycena olivaceomarginata]|nr:hypothetical protein B0H14DRAFT_3163919 [Mycena olivaceomarginata]